MLSIIVAMGENGEIGKDGVMPWNLPEDLKYFKETTMGKKLIMGKNTFYSLPKILPGRTHFVLSKSLEDVNDENVILHRDFKALVEQYEKVPEEIFVSGGAKIYSLFLPYCQKLYLTRIHKAFDADTFMPEIDFSLFKKTWASQTKTDPKTSIDFHFEVYDRL